jgi:hypothetical protein
MLAALSAVALAATLHTTRPAPPPAVTPPPSAVSSAVTPSAVEPSLVSPSSSPFMPFTAPTTTVTPRPAPSATRTTYRYVPSRPTSSATRRVTK